jgi:phosphoserine phosphatase
LKLFAKRTPQMALAIFDLDETLIHGDCATLWSEQMGRLGWVDPESFMRQNNELMDAYSHGKLRMEEYMTFSLEPMIGRTPEEVDHLVGPWVEDFIEPIIFSDATKAIAAHRKAGGYAPGPADCRPLGHRRDSRHRAGSRARGL